MFERMKWCALVIGCLLILPCLAGAEQEAGQTLYVTRILDLDVFDGRGQSAGEIDDLVIRRNGLIRTATLRIGGWVLGLSSKVVAYPLADLTIQEDRIVVRETQEDLERREEFDYFARGLPKGYYFGHYPPMGTPGYAPGYAPGYGQGYGPLGPGYGPGRPRRLLDPERQEAAPYEDRRRMRLYPEIFGFSPAEFLASVIIDRELIDPMGARLGRIRDLVIKQNRVEKIVLEARALGDNVYVALPYDTIGFTYYGVVYETTLEELEKMPKYDYARR